MAGWTAGGQGIAARANTGKWPVARAVDISGFPVVTRGQRPYVCPLIACHTSGMPLPRPELSAPTALLVDWGGVLTNSLDSVMAAWLDEENLEASHFSEVMRGWLGAEAGAEASLNPVHALEKGEADVPDFEENLAAALSRVSGREVTPAGLLTRMFEKFRHAPDMTALVRRAKDAGITTALLSNSWGNPYPDHIFDGMFDHVVISGEVGLRKPEPAIFHHTAALVGAPPSACVFVDDLSHNVAAATRLGFIAVHHTDYGTTADELSAIFGFDLGA